MTATLSRYLAGGIIALALWAAFGPQPEPIIYREVVVPARVIEDREVPGEVRWRDRIVYRYVVPEITATAPAGARLTVERFCAPSVAFALGDTTSQAPRQEMIRSVVFRPAWVPLRRGALLVTSATSTGDLLARDYRVRADFGVGSGDSVLVRYRRLSVAREVGRGLAWYLTFRLAEAAVMSVTR